MRTPLLLRAGTWLVCVFALVLAACDQGTVVGPDGTSSPDAPAGPSFSQDGMPAVSELGVDPSAMPSSDGQPLRAAKASTSTATVFSTLDGNETWPASLPYQAGQTWESGDFIRATQPGVLNTVHFGMSSWACETGGWHTGDCSTQPGETFSHPITLNLYQVDYSGTDPAPGNLIYSKTVTFEIPFRPSADDLQCTDGDDGKFFDDRFGACVNGYNVTLAFDFSGDDVVVPSEFMYGIEYNTQTYGPNPIGAPGPYNSLNFAYFDKTASPVLVGEDVEDGDILWEAPTLGFPFGLYDFGDLTDWPFTFAIQFDVTLAGHVTGGGWFTSPEGAYRVASDFNWFQGFEADAAGWLDSDDSWHGTVTRVASGTGGVASSSGGFHAIFEGNATGAPFTRFDGYRDTWPGNPWVAEIDVYLDPSWAAGTGFDYSVAANGSDGDHQRDYIFHVTKDSNTGKLLVAGSNNTNFAPREDLENINHHEVTGAGWYTLQHVFYEDNGALAVDLNLVDANGTTLFTETRFNAADAIPAEVGGNRYGWFTFLNVSGGIAVDDHSLTGFDETILLPSDVTGRASFGFVSRYKKGADVPTGNTQFTFKAGDLNFHSTAYDWLVVNQGGSNAQFKGTGTINNMPSPTGDDYRFMIWAGDDDPDTFRIKIWYEEGGMEQVVYDNGFDQPIEGGQIVVHDGKGK